MGSFFPWDAAIGGVSSVIGSIFGSRDNKRTNATNRQIAKETNEANIRMNSENNALQRELANQKYAQDLAQWNRQNEYNSPLAQKQRLLDAGLNPALQNVSTGVATSSPEAPLPATTAGHAEMGAPAQSYDWSNLSQDLYRGLVQYKIDKEQAKGLAIDNETKNLRNLALLENLREQTSSQRLQNAYQSFINSKQSELYNQRYTMNELDIESKRKSIDYQISQNSLMDKQLNVFDEQTRAQINKTLADISLIASQRNLNQAQIGNLAMNNLYLNASIDSLDADTKTKNEMRSHLVSRAIEEARNAGYIAEKSKHDAAQSYYDAKRKSWEWLPENIQLMSRDISRLTNGFSRGDSFDYIPYKPKKGGSRTSRW